MWRGRYLLYNSLALDQEREGHDRESIALPGIQSVLIDRAAAAAKKVILVVIGGGAIDLAAVKANPKVSAILIAGYPGQAGGQALAETVFGLNNPSGRLTQTWYHANFTSQCSMLDMNMRPNATTGCPGRGYRFFTGEVVFQFGHGLSYTSFTYEVVGRRAAALSKKRLDDEIEKSRFKAHTAGVVVTVEVNVTNTGPVEGTTVVLLMVKPPGAGKRGEPLMQLRRYTRLFLVPGDSQVLALSLTAHDLSTVDEAGMSRAIAGNWSVGTTEMETPFIVSVV